MTLHYFFDLIAQQTELWLVSATFVSLLVGSFLNVVIIRLPQAMQDQWHQECLTLLLQVEPDQGPPALPLAAITWPASHCPNCKTPLKAWHNIPLASFILLRGKCAFCTQRISFRYPLIELLTATLGFLVAWLMGPSLATLAALVLVYILVALSVIDLDHKLLPDQLTLPLMWLGMVVNSCGLITNLASALWGAILGYMSLWLVYWGFRLATGKHGMGYGDFKLLAALGAWLGWQAVPLVVLVAALAGIIMNLLVRMRSTPSDPRMPFGPCLSLGGLAFLLWGEQLGGIFQPY